MYPEAPLPIQTNAALSAPCTSYLPCSLCNVIKDQYLLASLNLGLLSFVSFCIPRCLGVLHLTFCAKADAKVLLFCKPPKLFWKKISFLWKFSHFITIFATILCLHIIIYNIGLEKWGTKTCRRWALFSINDNHSERETNHRKIGTASFLSVLDNSSEPRERCCSHLRAPLWPLESGTLTDRKHRFDRRRVAPRKSKLY